MNFTQVFCLYVATYIKYYYIPAMLVCIISTLFAIPLKTLQNVYLSVLSFLFVLIGPEFWNLPTKNMRIAGRPIWEGSIEKEGTELLKKKLNPEEETMTSRETEDYHKDWISFQFFAADAGDFLKVGMEAIIEDHITPSFEPPRLERWNILYRTMSQCTYPLEIKHYVSWFVGLVFRYAILVPIRLSCFVLLVVFGTIGCTVLLMIEKIPGICSCNVEMILRRFVSCHLFSFMGVCFGLFVDSHGEPPKGPVVGALNHTMHMDGLAVLVDGVQFSGIFQRNSGFARFLMKLFSTASPNCIVFERGHKEARANVIQMCRNYVKEPNYLPLFLMPEGYCINNTAIMQFQKGAFEASSTIYPVVITYDHMFCDAFWSQPTWGKHVWDIITSWALVAKIKYLPPVHQLPGEDAAKFASNVQKIMQKAGNLKSIDWSSGLYRLDHIKYKLLSNQQEKYCRYLMTNSQEIVNEI